MQVRTQLMHQNLAVGKLCYGNISFIVLVSVRHQRGPQRQDDGHALGAGMATILFILMATAFLG